MPPSRRRVAPSVQLTKTAYVLSGAIKSHIKSRSFPEGVLNRRFKRRLGHFAAAGKVTRSAERLDVDKISPMVGISIYSFVTDLLLITNELRVGMI